MVLKNWIPQTHRLSVTKTSSTAYPGHLREGGTSSCSDSSGQHALIKASVTPPARPGGFTAPELSECPAQATHLLNAAVQL